MVFAEEGPKLTHAAQDLDKKSKGLLAKAVEITGFKGKKDQTGRSDRAAGTEIRARRARWAWTRPRHYGQEDWLNLGGTVQGASDRQRGTDGACLARERGWQGITAADAASFALGALLRGYKFKKYKSKPKKKDGAAADTNDKYAEEDRRRIATIRRRRTRRLCAARAIADGVTLARDLVNEPANVLGPAEFAARAKELTKLGVQVERARTEGAAAARHERAARRGAGQRRSRATSW